MARAARFRTLHNEVLTPLFMPVGTHATVRGQRFESLEGSGSQILLANTYHLLLRPGPEVFKKLGGIHGLTRWPKSFLTDSGGFQIFAMPNDRRMSEEGAKFLSYVDGKHILLTPEKSIETQIAIGSDIMMVLDQCVPSTVSIEEAKAAMELSNRWAVRSLAARGDSPQSMFAIVQGACYPELRKRSAEFVTSLPFDGFALGGLAVGESKQEREDTVAFAAPLLPQDKPRYLMGVGTPIDLLEAVHRGIDMFDCIIPTAHAEQGVAYTWEGKILLRRGVYKDNSLPIDSNCSCFACQNYSKAYLHHLIKTTEPLGRQMVGLHNIHFYHKLMSSMREAILEDTFLSFYQTHRENLQRNEGEFPTKPPKTNPVPAFELGEYSVRVSPQGYGSIVHQPSGETMHSVSEPIQEATELYLQQSNFIERAKSDDEIVIWDVGLGAAANAMAVLHAFEKLNSEGVAKARVKLISFETDLNSLKLAMNHRKLFSYLQHGAPYAILAQGKWKSKKFPFEWEVRGEFLSSMEQADLPDLIFYDPFSSKTNSELWTIEALEKVAALAVKGRGAELFSYSASTAVRSTLLASGFYVAKGKSTGPKEETTIALSANSKLLKVRELLGSEWLDRWNRSDAKHPLTFRQGHAETLLDRVRKHPQFYASHTLH